MGEVVRINSLLGNNLTHAVLQMDRRLEVAVEVPQPILQMFSFHLCVNQSHGGGFPPTTIFNHRTEFPANLACQSLNRLFSSQLLFIIPIDLLCDATDRVFDYLIASLTNPRAAVIHIKADLTVVFDTTPRPPANPLLAPRVQVIDSVVIIDDLEAPPANLPRRPAWRSARDLKERYGYSSSSETAKADNNLGDCAICLEELQVVAGKSSSRKKVLKMPCSHRFHCRCIYKWLKTSNSCPLCRAVIS